MLIGETSIVELNPVWTIAYEISATWFIDNRGSTS